MKQSKFKETEIGEIPKGWEIVSFKDASIDIIDGDRGKNYPKKNEFKQEGFCLFLNTKNVPQYSFDFSECNFIDNGRDSLLGKGKLKRGDLVLTTRGTVGNVAHYHNDIDFTNIRVNSGMVILRNQEQEFDTRFLYLLLRSPIMKNQIMSFTTGSAQPQLPIRDINKIKLPTPSLDEQKAIAKILSDLDSKIELNIQMNDTLEAIGQALFKHWFVDFEFPNDEGKPYKSSGGEMVDSELGEIPERWKIVRFRAIIGLTMGLSPKGTSYNTIGEGLPLLNGAADFDNGQICPTKFTTEPTRICQKGDLLFCIRGTIGNLTFADNKYCLGRGVAAVMPIKDIYKEYIYFKLHRKVKYLISQATGSVIVGLTKPDILDTKIVVPDDTIIKKFHYVIENFFLKVENSKIQNKYLSQIRDSLLPRLMSGRIRVPIGDTAI